ncbi:S-layer homology domain-containing protein [Paenibacillus mendelii]|uniref:S-layer homology domain-containing protein n=1 Tax=Paenibacillus mendelii TaxID=206163 RepID=A0ABV6J828_9BACL|nr:S-layer homology domain-containing protein [Paenibacillus mendelii]MCQ6561298.1 S-layer homology domain-containing protein [Paenibacillus mendelii]
MNPISRKVAAILTIAALGSASLPNAVSNVQAANQPSPSAAASQLSDQAIQAAVKELHKLGIMQGYLNQMNEYNQTSRAELAKLVYKAFDLEDKADEPAELTDVNANAWYYDYAAKLVGLGIMEAENGIFNPQGKVTDAELAQVVSKALERDAKSVQYWMAAFYSASGSASRGETAYLIQTARKAIPSEHAKITSVRALNAITMIVTFDKPLTAADEGFAIAKENFSFDNDLTLTNMPRLKTGSIATYIVPTSVQQAGTTYTLTYKSKKAGSTLGSAAKVNMTAASQVTSDTFELESLKVNGVVDYGYIISAYSGGRGANAFILNDREQANGTTYQIIPSMQARQVLLTPENGSPIMAKYVPFTQSTDGKQEPKFRLPEGQTLTPGVKYTVTSDWANISSSSFVAKKFEPLQIKSVEAMSETSIQVTLAQDPGDELFSGRSMVLTAPNGDKLLATYKYSSRKGAVGVFDIADNGTIQAGTTYTVAPADEWATASAVTVTME